MRATIQRTDRSPFARWREWLLVLVLLAALVALYTHGPRTQSAAYHDFADQRLLFGVPNLLDVASNLPFLAIGLLGLMLCAGPRRPAAAASWATFFAGATLVAIGSAYYHWLPGDARLAWDRLPMTVAFTGLFVAVLTEHLGAAVQRYLLAPAVAIGVASVIWWRASGDLTLYLWVQFGPLACLPFVLALFRSQYTHQRYLLYALGLYALAKVAEVLDRQIFAFTAQLVSGHTVKHLLAASALLVVLLMLKRRAPVSDHSGTPTTGRKGLLPVMIGNALEWFDFTVYGFFAPTIARQFFPPGDDAAALLATAASFGVAFVMRPIGAVTFGWIGDRWGRKTSLMLTFGLMALGTGMIGLAPTYASAGLVAAAVLVLGRLLQGFSASGEAGSAFSMAMESAAPDRRGVASGWLSVGVYSALVFGSLAGLAVNSLLPPADAEAWGWRVPFLLGLLVAPVGLYLRWNMRESHAFLAVGAAVTRRVDERAADFRPALRGIVTMIGLAGFGSPVVYLILIFMPSYATRELGLSQQVPMLSTFVASVLLVLLLVPMGRLSDRFGSRALMLLASSIGAAVVVPLMSLLTRAPGLATLLLLQCSLSLCLAMYVASGGPLAASLFSVQRRALGIGLGYNLGIILFGAFAPFVTAWLIEVSGDRMMVAWYTLITGSISVVTLIALGPQTRSSLARSMSDDDQSRRAELVTEKASTTRLPG